jgi:hypothetical protein
MTNDTLHLDMHPADGDILRFNDGACDWDERIRIEQHLAECPVCCETSQLFEAASNELSLILDELDVEPAADAKERVLVAAQKARRSHEYPDAWRWRGGSLRAAAILVAVLGASLWVLPVRAWVFEFLGASQPVQGNSLAAPEVVAPLPPPVSSTISFLPTSPTFGVEIGARQTEGSLVLRAGQSASASARVTGRDPTDAFLVTGNGIQIDNSEMSTATYNVTVPVTLSQVRVRFGDGETLSYLVGHIASQDSLVVSLQPH